MGAGYEVLAGLKYSLRHAWVRPLAGSLARVGVTRYISGRLAAVVFVEGPRVGEGVVAGEVLAWLEAVDTVIDVHSPVTGIVVARNEELDEEPWLVHRDPYGRGWIAELALERPQELDYLLTAEQYARLVSGKVIA